MTNVRTSLSAASLVLFPLLILAYWLLYPAYGLLEPAAILRAIEPHPRQTMVANAFAVSGAFLAVPATLALVGVIRERSPRLTLVGGSLTVIGWIALVGVLMSDVVAAQIVEHGGVNAASVELFEQISFSPTMLALNGLVSLHIVGGVLTGIALLRTGLVARWVGLIATFTHPIHLAANLGGVLWLDALTWIALAIAYAYVARVSVRPERARTAGA